MDVSSRVLALLALSGCNYLVGLRSFEHQPDPPDAPAIDAPPAEPPNIVFVSSMAMAPSSFGGVAAADAHCQALADAHGLGGHYVAWLSSLPEDARSHLEATIPRGWVRPDGKPFADTVNDLVRQRTWYPLRITEAGADLDGQEIRVATATSQTGTYLAGQGCTGFTQPGGTVGAGYADADGFYWTSADGQSACTVPMHVYCFGIDHTVPVSVVAESTRFAFVSSVDIAAASGRAAFDQECQSEAAMAGHAGTFKAAVAVAGSSALGRFTPGVPWVRADGVTVIGSDLTFEAPIDQSATGAYDPAQSVFIGATSLAAVPASAASTCNNWTSAAGNTAIGDSSRSGHNGIAAGLNANNCALALRLYCLQE